MTEGSDCPDFAVILGIKEVLLDQMMNMDDKG
jgi:hypothetical protein